MTDSLQRFDASGYWYPEDRTRRAVDVLSAMRAYRAAESSMRRRTRSSMGMGETDLLALQFLLRAGRRGEQVSAKDLAAYLRISPASTSVLIDRLERSGHVARRPHPSDRRAIVVEATGDSSDEVRATLGRMHERMLAVAEQLDDADATAIVAFLTRLKDAVDEPDPHDAMLEVSESERSESERPGPERPEPGDPEPGARA